MTRDPRTCPYHDAATRHAARIVAELGLTADQRARLADSIVRALCDAYETGLQVGGGT